MKKIFISYYHKSEQKEKNKLSKLFKQLYSEYFTLKDKSLKPKDVVNGPYNDREIFKILREKFIKDSDVTIVILGKYTKDRKFVDWEVGSSLSLYGSLGRRKKKNDLIILLTDDFIEKEKAKNPDFKGENYSLLINEQNSGQRIFDNVDNGYATVKSFRDMWSNPNELKKLINKPQDNSKKVISPDNKSQLKTKNEKECPFEQSKFEINEINLIQKSENNIKNNKIKH